jgi:hypothetical protein
MAALRRGDDGETSSSLGLIAMAQVNLLLPVVSQRGSGQRVSRAVGAECRVASRRGRGEEHDEWQVCGPHSAVTTTWAKMGWWRA